MGQLHLLDHPLIQSKITKLRDKNTVAKEFREITKEVSGLMCYEATKALSMIDVEVESQLAKADGKVIANEITLVPILRAGLGMVEGMTQLVPTAKIGHIGLYRDPGTLTPVEYYCKLPPNIASSMVYILDPMLATGGTAVEAVKFLKERGAKTILFLAMIVCPKGVQRFHEAHPDVDIIACACDETLNDHGYIVPGLGDAGDRLFGTK